MRLFSDLYRRAKVPYWGVQTRLHIRRQKQLLDEFIKRYGFVVQEGPFAGMRYLNRTRDPILPKLIGSYESELHPAFQRIATGGYEIILDFGCAEGYYAVGLAKLLPNSQIHAFDIDPTQQADCLELARLNDVEDRITIHGEATREHIGLLAEGRTLLIVDCEGWEYQLLDPAQLNGCDVLVELHSFDGTDPQRFLRKFEDTQEVEVIPRQRRRDPSAFHSISFLSPSDQRIAIAEFRDDGVHGNYWAFIGSKRGEKARQSTSGA